jgi:hypothetical protein
VSRLETITALAVVAVVALALAAVAWTMPAARSVLMTSTYRQSGSFGYDARAVSAQTVYGTSGLRTDFPIVARSNVSGHSTTVGGQLPTAEMLKFVRQAEHALGGTNGVPSTITITPRIAVSAIEHGERLADRYSPSLTFDVDGATLRLAQPEGVASSHSAMNPQRTGTTSYSVVSSNRMSFVPLQPTVTVVRVAALALALVCGLLALWLALPLLRPRGQAGEAARIRALYGSRIVEVSTLSLPEGPVADLSTMEALAEVAKRYEAMILHVPTPESYLVWDDGLLYRYCPVPLLHPVGDHVAREA